MQANPVVKDVVLVGGGHSHVHVLKMFGMRPLQGVRLTLITRDMETPYSGMLPGHVAGFYTKEECHLDLAKLSRFANTNLIQAAACGIDVHNKIVMCSDRRPPIPYDIVSVDIGSSPCMLSSADASITPVKPIDGFSARWSAIVERVANSTYTGIMQIVVVGGGAGGVELAFAMHARLRKELSARQKDPNGVVVSLVNRQDALLYGHNTRARALVQQALQDRGINLILNQQVVECAADASGRFLLTEAGLRISYDECIWCTQAGAQQWLRNTELELSTDGFIAVKRTLQSTKFPDVFACGDCCHMVEHPRPKAGVFAVRQGPPLFNNLRALLLNEPLEEYVPQTQWLQMIGTGDGDCIASRGPIALQGTFLWRLKDHIDRTWMTGYQQLPRMEAPSQDPAPVAQIAGGEALEMLQRTAMRCGGCGSKVGSSILSRALRQIANLVPKRAEVLVGLESPDDVALVAPPPPGYLLVQTVDFFRAHVSDPYIFGRVAANHALSDCHAKNADAVSALAIAVVPYGLESKVEHTLVQMLAGACVALGEVNCALIGGHTSEGPELALGFAITGTLKKDCYLAKSGASAGHVLILTKAVGTGTIMAADMRAQAKGLWVSGACNSMLQSNRRAADILFEHGCSACTDVTGFGVIGHLLEMLQTRTHQPTALGAEIFLQAVPVLEGAIECIEQGIFSSLQPHNTRNRHAVRSTEEQRTNPRFALLFDPQTAGGLLATVPPEHADACASMLREAGYSHTRQIGKITETVVLDERICIA